MAQLLRFDTFVEVICAAHLTRFVESPFQGRGGILIVGPPGIMKSTILGALEVYSDAVVLTDINNQSLGHLRESITSGTISTLAVSDLQKIYERHPQVAANVEGTVRALVEEGWKGAAFQDSRINRLNARCMVMGGLTPEFVEDHFTKWMQSGFLRRFLYVLYRLDNPQVLSDAVEEWKLLDIGIKSIQPPVGTSIKIPNMLTREDRAEIRGMLKFQYGTTLPFQLLCKIGCVLEWHYQRHGIKKRALDTLSEFSQTLSREGATVTLDEDRRTVAGKKDTITHAKRLKNVRKWREVATAKRGGNV